MKVAYLDISSGVSGDMLLAALINAGAPLPRLKKELKKVNITGYTIKANKAKHNGIEGTSIQIHLKHQPRYKMSEIARLIKHSRLRNRIKFQAQNIFGRLGHAESVVHGQPIRKLHVHDIGATDAILDILGTLICLDMLGIKKVYASPFNTGIGSLRYIHGKIPVPAPATTELIKGLPIIKSLAKAELTTPTGAAIVSGIADSFGEIPSIEICGIGYGIGSYRTPELSPLRVIIGNKMLGTEKDAILKIETNIDDTPFEAFPMIIKKLMRAGALDAYIFPIMMKKKRIGMQLNILCNLPGRDQILKTIFSETTTLGVRTFLVKREKLFRQISPIKTKYGRIRLKTAILDDKTENIMPEFEDCRKIARKNNLSLKAVYALALTIFAERNLYDKNNR